MHNNYYSLIIAIVFPLFLISCNNEELSRNDEDKIKDYNRQAGLIILRNVRNGGLTLKSPESDINEAIKLFCKSLLLGDENRDRVSLVYQLMELKLLIPNSSFSMPNSRKIEDIKHSCHYYTYEEKIEKKDSLTVSIDSNKFFTGFKSCQLSDYFHEKRKELIKYAIPEEEDYKNSYLTFKVSINFEGIKINKIIFGICKEALSNECSLIDEVILATDLPSDKIIAKLKHIENIDFRKEERALFDGAYNGSTLHPYLLEGKGENYLNCDTGGI